MSQLILARGNAYKKNIFQKHFPNIEFGPYFLVVSLVLFVILVTVITLMFSTRQVTKGYVLSKLEAEHQDLIEESERTERQISQVRALNYIENSPQVLAMRNPSQLVFVDGDTVVASR